VKIGFILFSLQLLMFDISYFVYYETPSQLDIFDQTQIFTTRQPGNTRGLHALFSYSIRYTSIVSVSQCYCRRLVESIKANAPYPNLEASEVCFFLNVSAWSEGCRVNVLLEYSCLTQSNSNPICIRHKSINGTQCTDVYLQEIIAYIS